MADDQGGHGGQGSHRVIILGGGFGGLSAVQKLKRAPVEVILFDRRNFHLFQPLMYQVATGSLSPGEIAAPLRGVLSRQKNTQVLLGEVSDIDPAGKESYSSRRRLLRLRLPDRGHRLANLLLRQ